MRYEYGVTFNAAGGDVGIGGGEEGYSDVSYVSNDRQKLIDHVLKENPNVTFTTEHEYVGEFVDNDNEVLGVFVEVEIEDGEDVTYVLCALISDVQVADVI